MTANQEIEYKFLVDKDKLPALTGGEQLIQGYVSGLPDGVALRFRVKGSKGYVTVKVAGDEAAIRDEYEVEASPAKMQAHIRDLCPKTVIDKTRYEITYEGRIWEVDVFHGRHEGLILAEIELPSKDTVFTKPDWVTRDVTDNVAYSNSCLAINGLPR